jgi:adenine C2-methylase RlmN of 23S rRNA A2503 and tRNA A37
VNWVRPAEPGYLEARFVRRVPEYVVAYLSSQTGCRQACRMCHLTATGQTALRDTTLEEFHEQADVVLAHYRTVQPARSIHFNFMARGEPLVNSVVRERSGELFDGLWQRARAVGLRPRYLVSTILPRCLGERPLEEIFDRYHPELYYSLYSMDPAVRRRWLPKALPADEGLDRLAQWQRHTYKLVKVHYAFIEGVNDDEASVHAVCDALVERDLLVHVNIVRYNPAGERQGREPSEVVIERNAGIFAERLTGARVKVIPRVGFDVAASCGMFVGSGTEG